MRKLIAMLVAAAAALVFGAAPVAAAPGQATGQGSDQVTVGADARKAKPRIKVTRSAKYYHHGMKGVKVTAKVTRGKKSGKAKFFLGKKKRATKKLKKGKASWRMPATLAPGKYKVRVKIGKASKTVKVKVQNSQLKVNATSFTIPKTAPSYDYSYPELSGTVKFKGKWAKTGWVDIYRDGKKKGGSSSPHYVAMASVKDGQFTFSSYGFLGKVADKYPAGTYKFQAFYTPTASFSEYIHSSIITVTVTE